MSYCKTGDGCTCEELHKEVQEAMHSGLVLSRQIGAVICVMSKKNKELNDRIDRLNRNLKRLIQGPTEEEIKNMQQI